MSFHGDSSLFPIKIAIIEKEQARSERWEDRIGGKPKESLASPLSLPILRRALSFSLTPASLRQKEEEEKATTKPASWLICDSFLS